MTCGPRRAVYACGSALLTLGHHPVPDSWPFSTKFVLMTMSLPARQNALWVNWAGFLGPIRPPIAPAGLRSTLTLLGIELRFTELPLRSTSGQLVAVGSSSIE